jgi:hypothetical protein
LFSGVLGGAALPLAGLLGVNAVLSGQQAQTQQTIEDYNADHPADSEAAKYFGTEYAREHKAQIRHGGMQIVNDTPYGPENAPTHAPTEPSPGNALTASMDALAKVFQQGQQQPIVVPVPAARLTPSSRSAVRLGNSNGT